jgi:Tfp pilus assembly PilM family ATPase
MPVRELTIGLALTDRGVQAVEIERNGPVTTLLAIDEWENTLSLHDSDNISGTEQFVEYLSAFLKVNQIRARRASVALDSSLLFLSMLPMEEGLTRAEITEQIVWELQQYFPQASPKEFISDIHSITHPEAEHWREVLSVSVRRNHAIWVQKALAAAGLELHILDVDHFAADTALRLNYPDAYRKYVALAGVKENRVDISLIRNGSMESYSYTTVHSNKEIVDRIARLSHEAKGIFSITTYGPYLDRDLLTQIRRGSRLLVEAMNPLRHVNVSDSLRIADHLSMPSYRFAAAVGAALRRD